MSGYGIRKTDMKYLLMCAGLLFTVFQSWGQERLADRIAPPSGYVRETCSDNSFTTYLRNLSLLPYFTMEKKKPIRQPHLQS